MLTDDDVAFIRANRAEIKQHRTESVSVEYKDGTTDSLAVIWKEPSSPTGTEARNVGDYTIYQNDYVVTFDDTAPINNVVKIFRGNGRYVLTDIDERGLGGLNRYECRALLVVTSGQFITLIHGGVEDGWGQPVNVPPPTNLDAYVSEEMQTVTNQLGEEAVSQLRVVLDGMVNVSYRDKIQYINEFGTKVERKPLRVIFRKRTDGTPLVTEVYV